MKLMKLLLIGLLSVVALAACAEDEAATAKAAYTIVGPDKLAPVLFDNTSAVQLQVLDAAGVVTTKAVTYATSTGAKGFDVSATGEITVNLKDAIAGTVIATVTTDADATATPPVVAGTEEVSYTPAVSALVLKSIAVTPATAVVKVDATLALIATATFGEGEAAKTAVIANGAWVSTTPANATVVATTGVVTGKIVAATTNITVAYTSNGVALPIVTKAVEVEAAGSASVVKSFTAEAPTTMPTAAGASIVLVIKEVVGTATATVADLADYTCTLTSVTATGIMVGTTPSGVAAATGACDTLKTGAASGDATVTVTHTTVTGLAPVAAVSLVFTKAP